MPSVRISAGRLPATTPIASSSRDALADFFPGFVSSAFCLQGTVASREARMPRLLEGTPHGEPGLVMKFPDWPSSKRPSVRHAAQLGPRLELLQEENNFHA